MFLMEMNPNCAFPYLDAIPLAGEIKLFKNGS